MAPPVVLPNSSINKTASELGKAPAEMQELAQRLIQYGGGKAPAGAIGLSMGDYSVPIYRVSFDTSGRPVPPAFWAYEFPVTFSVDQNSQGNVKPGTKIPDNKAWKPGTGNDNMFCVEDRATGRVWSFWMARQPGYNAINLTNIFAGLGWKVPQHIVGCCNLTYPFRPDAKVTPERGMGIDRRAMVVTGEELLTGKIKHAAQLTIANTWYCDSLKTAVEGTDWFAPATRCEFDKARYQTRNRDGILLDLDRTKLIPEGLRVAFDLSAAERIAWLDKMGFVGKFREFCAMIVDCWCDYGVIIGETGGHGMNMTMSGMIGPDRPIYESYGWRMDTLVKQEQSLSSFMNDNAHKAYVVQPSH